MNKIKKFVVGLTLFGLMMAPVVTATTADDLAAQIATLQAQLNQLMAQHQQLTGTVPAVSVVCTFTRNLYPGMSGADVKCLQEYLNAAGHTVATTGAGSAGNETMYYGSRTQAAVKTWQEALGVSYGAWAGYFGPMSIARFNETGTTPTTPTDPTDPTTPTDPVEDTTGVEGTLSVVNLPLPSSVEVGPNTSNVAVTGFQIKAKESNVRVQRIDLAFADTTTTTLRNAISHVTLYDGDNALQGVTLTRDTVTTAGVTSTVRFSGLNILVPKDGSKDIKVHVSIPNNPTIVGTSQAITVNVLAEAVRGIDGAGLQQYNTGTASRAFTIDTDLEAAKVTLSRNANTPAKGILLGSQDNTMPGQELTRFDVKVENQSVTVEEVTVSLTDASSTVAYLRLYDGETLLATEIATAGTNKFENLQVSIAKGATKALRVVAELNKITKTMEDAGVQVTVSGVAGYDSENEDFTSTGSAVGEAQLVYSAVPELTRVSANIQAATDQKTAAGTLEFKVKAVGGKIRVTTTSAAVTAVEFTNTTTSKGTIEVAGKTATAGYYVFEEGQEATFSVPVSFAAHTGHSVWVRVAVDDFVWQVEAADDTWKTITWSDELVESLRSSQVMISQ